jgi:hypothetical protein
MAMVGHRTEAIDRCYAIVDEIMLQEGGAKLALYSEGKVLGKVKAVTEATGGPNGIRTRVSVTTGQPAYSSAVARFPAAQELRNHVSDASASLP